MKDTGVVIIGYSGHAFVVCDILLDMGKPIAGYCEATPKAINPYHLSYWGNEQDEQTIQKLKEFDYFVAIGDNTIRKRVQSSLTALLKKPPITIQHSSAIVSKTAKIGHGVLLGPNSIVNALAIVEDGSICNSNAVVEHECHINSYAHLAPSSTLCGNVSIGSRSLVGAGSIVIPNLSIGHSCLIGAGSVVIKDVLDNKKIAGNPAKEI